MEVASDVLLIGQLQYGYAIRSITHSHPFGDAVPSGTRTNSTGTPAGAWGDMGNKNSIESWYKTQYPDRYVPLFYVRVKGGVPVQY
jgi:hypothetical protein